MKKSKIISLSKIILFLFLLSIIYTAYFINKDPKTVFNESTKEIIGTIIESQKLDNGYKFTVQSDEKIIVYYYEEINLKLGNKIKIKGDITKPPENTVFNLFNYRNYLKSQKIYWTMTAKKITIISNNEGIYFIKNKLISYINNFKSHKYLNAFILGNDDEINEDVYESYQRNGISHLLAISGSQITVISIILLFILNLFFKNKNFNYLIVIILLLFYMFLTGFMPPIVRATLLFTIITIKNIIRINIKTIYLLILIAAFYLFYNPFIIMNIGFLFSFIICFYLILFSNYIQTIKSYIGKIFIISLIAFIASTPILIYNFHYINLLTPFINLIFVPLVTFLIYPLSLIVMIMPFLDNILFVFCENMEKISLYLNNFDNYIIVLKHINIYIMIFYYIFIYLVIYKLSKKQYLMLVLFICLLLLHSNINYLNKNPYLTMIDVGQGDCFLLVLPHNKGNILIDTGGKLSYNKESYDLSKNTILPYLRSEGINKIDYLIITHGDYDHMGESINLVNNFKVENVIFNAVSYNDLESELINVLKKKNINYSKNKNEIKIDKYKLKFLYTQRYTDENDSSTVIYTEINNVKMLFMGDAGKTKEKDILKKYDISDIDILKVGHHGSNTSSSKYFVDKINPKTCLISVGENNYYGHPSKDVLKILGNCNIYRTDLNGSIKIKIDNNKYSIEKIK